ncbi:ovochymase-1 [Bombina bombina]|uniref:ovochymase-1 n=1 Tax=Bombina bombina TaxID=8345 RepID=UPI00235AFD2D|nr:ovochymase-1 [Bombina bombina]
MSSSSDVFQRSVIRNKEQKCGSLFTTRTNEKTGLPRIVGGINAVPGGQPWTVSLRLYDKHICGGSLVQRSVVVTAAHCVYPVHPIKVSHMTVVAGEYDQNTIDPEEQTLTVSHIVVHPKYNGGATMGYDIAIVYLSGQVNLGNQVQLICLPQLNETIEAGTLCTASGWGRINETGDPSPILQEVQLPVIDNVTCSSVLSSMELPNLHKTMMCAGFPDGGKDACQGDSGGPLVCKRRTGSWFLVGCTSWGLGCGRAWKQTRQKKNLRGSPAIFSRVSSLLSFLRNAQQDGGCRTRKLNYMGNSGIIRYPESKKSNYTNNSLCNWDIKVEEDTFIQINITLMDIENQAGCIHDYLAFTVKDKTIRKMCGSIVPSPLLISSNHVTVTFFSDATNTGQGFELRYSAVAATSAGSGCDSLAVLKTEGKIYTINYPGLYPSYTTCHWIIEAPKDHIIKLWFEDFALEFQKNCEYDHVSIYDENEETNLLAKLCGSSLPPPIFSPRNTMFIFFRSDQETNYPGFKASFVFLPSVNGVVYARLSLQHAPLRFYMELGSQLWLSEFSSWSVSQPCAGEATELTQTIGRVVLERKWLRSADPSLAQVVNENSSKQLRKIVGDVLKKMNGPFHVTLGNSPKSPGDPRPGPVDKGGLEKRDGPVIGADAASCSGDKEEKMAAFRAPSDQPEASTTDVVKNTVPAGNNLSPVQATLRRNTDLTAQRNSEYGEANGAFDKPITVDVPKAKSVPLDVCGVAPLASQGAMERIVGGQEACTNCWPWQVGLKFMGEFYCGGVIISSQWVLTAAHCIEGSSNPAYWEVIAGDHDRYLVESTEQIRHVQAIVVHKDFSQETYDYDIALVFLKEPLKINSYVRPICLPPSDEPLSPSSMCVVTGWGNTLEDGTSATRLQQLELPILDNQVCNKSYYSDHPGGITDRMFCAGFPSLQGKDSCQGDSGGPLVCDNDKPFFLYGLVSWGEGCARAKRPGVYTKVRMFLSWIQETQQVLQSHENAVKGQPNEVNMQPRTSEEKTATSDECSSEVELKESVGSIASPGYPYGYLGGLSCFWFINVPLSSIIKIRIEQLSIEETENCTADSLSIFEDSSKGKVLLGKNCGYLSSPVIYRSAGPVIRVEFHSMQPGTYEKHGFVITYKKYGGQVNRLTQLTKFAYNPKSENCSDVVITSSKGTIATPGYPGTYSNDLWCEWRIIAPLGHIIHLDLQDLETENSESGCEDSLQVYEGIGKSKRLLGNFCGEMHSHSLKSEGSEMTLIFETNSKVTLRGFSINYSTWENKPACPILDLLPAGSADIKSPGYPNLYPNELDCKWIIYSTTGKRLLLVITDLFLEYSSRCTLDFLNVHDGPNNRSNLLGTFCGSKTDLHLQSSGSYLTLHFHTDSSVGDRGFKVHYSDLTESSVQISKMLGNSRSLETCGYASVDPMPKARSNTMVKLTIDDKKTRVVAGYPALPKSWPWIVSLQTYKKKHFCGGTIIHSKWILTAGHCEFSVGLDRVFVGQNNLSLGEREAFVSHAYTHQLYDPDQIPPNNDISLLELTTPLTFDDSVSAICLPEKNDSFTNADCLIAGWGSINPYRKEYPTYLQQAKVPLVSNTACKSHWGSDITDNNVCAGAAGTSSCMGDSGGPLICKLQDQYKLVGAVSWGSDVCDVKIPAVYTQVSLFRDWISQYTGF